MCAEELCHRGGFQIKYMIRDGESREEVLEHYSGKVLGIPWELDNNKIKMNIEVNLLPKEQKQRTGAEVTEETLYLIRQVVLM